MFKCFFKTLAIILGIAFGSIIVTETICINAKKFKNLLEDM